MNMLSGNKIPFWKVNAIGNDFVVFIDSNIVPNIFGKVDIEKICNRKTGVGADGVVLLSKNADGLYNFEIYNSDGTVAEICGNALRASHAVLDTVYGVEMATRQFYTKIGLKETFRKESEFGVILGPVTVSSKHFGSHSFEIASHLAQKIDAMSVSCVSVGNPHIAFRIRDSEDLSNFDICSMHKEIVTSGEFPEGVNLEIYKKVENSQEQYSARVFERGCGETLGCGTGAVAISSNLEIEIGSEIDLKYKGGNLRVKRLTGDTFTIAGLVSLPFSGIIGGKYAD